MHIVFKKSVLCPYPYMPFAIVKQTVTFITILVSIQSCHFVYINAICSRIVIEKTILSTYELSFVQSAGANDITELEDTSIYIIYGNKLIIIRIKHTK